VRIFGGESKYVAECMDLPVVTRGDTLDEVTANIREAIGLHLEDEGLAELGISPDPTIVATISDSPSFPSVEVTSSCAVTLQVGVARR
jgi:predicted RNase H-like HicB family nuclease